jgi:hypothetical protein
MAHRLRHLLALATLAALAADAPARADELVAELSRETPVAAYGGALAWSAYDAASDRFRLVVAAPGAAAAVAPVAASRRAFDASLGPGPGNHPVALYTRCRRAETRCDIYRYDVLGRRETRLRFSSARADEALPVQWGARVAFVRRHGMRPRSACDALLVKTLTSTRPARRLDRGSCGRTTGLSLRGDRIVQVTYGRAGNARRFESQVRVLAARGGAERIVARNDSRDGSSAFASPNQSADAIWLTRTGDEPEPMFVVIDLRTGRPQLAEVPAHASLTGSLARDEHGTTWYVEGAFREGSCEFVPIPCRLVRASASPFSDAERALLPRLTISAPSDQLPSPIYGDPFVVSGQLTRPIVSGDRIVRSEPIAGVPVELLRRIDDFAHHMLRERFVPTGLFATTDGDGRWSYTLTDPPSQPLFSAVTRAPAAVVPPTHAGRGTIGAVAARITLTVSGTSFSGTIAPAQPRRTVKIQRLRSRTCQTLQSGQRSCREQWSTVGEAPVDASGTGFATTIAAPQPGTYSAVLPVDSRRDPAAYAGRSPDTPVG